MSRPKTIDLLGIDPKEFVGVDHDIVMMRKLEGARNKKHKLVEELKSLPLDCEYEEVSGRDHQIKYLDKAMVAYIDELEEMGIDYTMPKKNVMVQNSN